MIFSAEKDGFLFSTLIHCHDIAGAVWNKNEVAIAPEVYEILAASTKVKASAAHGTPIEERCIASSSSSVPPYQCSHLWWFFGGFLLLLCAIASQSLSFYGSAFGPLLLFCCRIAFFFIFIILFFSSPFFFYINFFIHCIISKNILQGIINDLCTLSRHRLDLLADRPYVQAMCMFSVNTFSRRLISRNRCTQLLCGRLWAEALTGTWS